MDKIRIVAPDDWHVHVRDGETLKAVIPWTARFFRRAIIMPNLSQPVTTTRLALEYRQRILSALPAGAKFEPLMTIYLTDETSADDLREGLKARAVVAAKLYPVNATTNAEKGVTDIRKIYPSLQALSDAGRPLLVHAESSDPAVDVFDREQVFLEEILARVLVDFPKLKVVVEHITTKEAVAFVRAGQGRVAATITPHHLLINRNAMFKGGLRPHFYCLPVAKRESHRVALVEAAVSGEPCFFLGTDSAPHTRSAKESACGCAGIFSAPTALSLYAQVFAAADRLKHFEGFASLYGPRFYGLPTNGDHIELAPRPWRAPESVRVASGEEIVVFEGGRELAYS